MRRKAAILLLYTVVLFLPAVAQTNTNDGQKNLLSLANDTNFLSKKVKSGYLSGNVGICLPQMGFSTYIGQNKPYMLPGSIDNFGLAIPIAHTGTGLAMLIGEGSDKADALNYCKAFAAQTIGNGTVTDAHLTYYSKLYYMLGAFHTFPNKIVTIDVRAMFGLCLWYSPDGTFKYQPAANASDTTMTVVGGRTKSLIIDGGIDLRYGLFERFDIIINADVVNGFVKSTHLFEYTISAGIAYEL